MLKGKASSALKRLMALKRNTLMIDQTISKLKINKNINTTEFNDYIVIRDNKFSGFIISYYNKLIYK